METECCYINGKCGHPECYEWWYGGGYYDTSYPQPTVEDYCAADGHIYHGDDSPETGRCYCGHKQYPVGGLK